MQSINQKIIENYSRTKEQIKVENEAKKRLSSIQKNIEDKQTLIEKLKTRVTHLLDGAEEIKKTGQTPSEDLLNHISSLCEQLKAQKAELASLKELELK